MCFYHGDCETAEIWRDTVRRARRAHRCDECDDGIEAAARYLESKYLYDGAWYTQRTCRRCEYDIYRIFRREREEGCVWSERFPATGELSEALGDAGWERTAASAVPAEFDCGWRVNEWAEELKARLAV